jgi:type II secretory pathway pseudopilin PulG
MQSGHGRRGARFTRPALTMLDLITVVVILGVISVIAIPRYADFVAQQRLNAAVRRVSTDLELAQQEARFTGTSRTVTFDVAANRYSLEGTKDIDHPTEPYVVYLGREPYRVTMASADFGGDADIVFNGYGVPDSGGSVILRIGKRQSAVTVDVETGRVLDEKLALAAE